MFWRGSGTTPDYGGEYTEGLIGQPRYLNPLLATANDVDADISRVIYAALYKYDGELNLVPDLIADLQIAPDGKVFTIRIKDNVYWHDGVKMTADDLVYTYQIIQNLEYGSPLHLTWNRVTVEKIDDLTLRLTTREASTSFLNNLTVGILPKHIWANIKPEAFGLSSYNLEPVGSGPYQVTGIKRFGSGEIRELRLKRFDRYHAGKPYLAELTFKFYDATDSLITAYQGREIMGLGYVPFDQSLFLEPKKNLKQLRFFLPQYQAVFINRLKNPAPLGDVRVRLALAKAVDKKRIITEVYGNQAEEAYGPILPGALGYHEQIPGADMNIYEPQKSEALLDQAGWVRQSQPAGVRRDKQGRALALSLATNNFSPNVRVAEALKEMWESLGVQINLNIEVASDLEEKFIRPRNFELLLFSENVGGDPDPYPYWHSSQLRDPGANLTNFSNKEADKLLIEARGIVSPETRAEKYKKFQEVFVGDAPAIFIDRSLYVYNISKDVKGLDLKNIVTPPDRFADINKWYIETK